MVGSRGRPAARHSNASPEAAAGGGLALLRTGDRIRIDLRQGTANMLVSDEKSPGADARSRRREGIPFQRARLRGRKCNARTLGSWRPVRFSNRPSNTRTWRRTRGCPDTATDHICANALISSAIRSSALAASSMYAPSVKKGWCMPRKHSYLVGTPAS